MKLLKKILLAVMISISIDVFAENPTCDGSGFIPVKTVTLHMKSASNRPKMPSNAVIVCSYSTNYLIISVPETAEYVYVRLYNEGEEFYKTVDAANPMILIPSLSGIYEIECTTDTGNTFWGEMEF